MSKLTVISLGAGVQSSVMALMAAKGEITPMPDYAIFADTQAEPDHIYEWLDWLESQLPFPVLRVTRGSLLDDIMNPEDRSASPPFFTASPSGVGEGILMRQCTRDYKVTPIQRKLRELAGYKPRQRIPADTVEQWIGISTDEIQRMKDAPEKWCNNRWPLIEKHMSRWHCLRWMRDNGYNELPRKSACTFCPYHDNATWREMKANDPKSWEQAVAVDKHIRDDFRGTTSKIYIHRSLVPLDEADLADPAADQIVMDFGDECDGMCGV